MSKRNKGQSMMYQPAGSKKNALVRPKAGAGGRKIAKSKSTARAPERQARPASLKPGNVLRLRISSAVIAAAALIGGAYMVLNAKGSYSTEFIVGLIALGFLAGLMIFAAIRTEYVIQHGRQFNRR